ncbi:MAG: hypothetical protein HYY18_16800 [Planctomycetes bacterium]|nr:hypothetical protein [Planctomycetota bacterium]
MNRIERAEGRGKWLRCTIENDSRHVYDLHGPEHLEHPQACNGESPDFFQRLENADPADTAAVDGMLDAIRARRT